MTGMEKGVGSLQSHTPGAFDAASNQLHLQNSRSQGVLQEPAREAERLSRQYATGIGKEPGLIGLQPLWLAEHYGRVARQQMGGRR